jgi:hypothetical protein
MSREEEKPELEILDEGKQLDGEDLRSFFDSIGNLKDCPNLVAGVVIRRSTEDPSVLSVDAWTAGINKLSAANVYRDIARTLEEQVANEIARRN